MFGSHHHLQRESLAARPFELFSISSRDQNTSLTRRGLSAAAPHSASLCGQDYRLPRGGRSASSLRTSRRVTSRVNEPTRRLRCEGSMLSSTVVLTRNGAQNFHLFRIARRRLRCTDRPMNKFQPRSSTAQLRRQIHF